MSGIVRDDAGQPVAGASLTILDGANANRTATTDATGAYRLDALSSGGFTVRIRRDGHEDNSQSVTLAASTSLNVTLVRLRLALSGNWAGSYSEADRSTRRRLHYVMTATVTHADTLVSATFTIGEGSIDETHLGSFSGTLDSSTPTARFTGTMTVNALISSGTGRCNSTHNVTGTVTARTIVLFAPGPWTWEQCIADSEDVTVTLNRQ